MNLQFRYHPGSDPLGTVQSESGLCKFFCVLLVPAVSSLSAFRGSTGGLTEAVQRAKLSGANPFPRDSSVGSAGCSALGFRRQSARRISQKFPPTKSPWSSL